MAKTCLRTEIETYLNFSESIQYTIIRASAYNRSAYNFVEAVYGT
jgi:hypothetical protein